MKQPMKVLLDQIQHTTIGKQNNKPTDSVESEPESDSNSQDSSTNDSEEGLLVTVAPVWQCVTKKKVVAKVITHHHFKHSIILAHSQRTMQLTFKLKRI